MAGGKVEIGIELVDDGAASDAKREGKKAGDAYGSSFGESSEKAKKRDSNRESKETQEDSKREGKKAGEAYGDSFTANASKSIKRIGATLAALGAGKAIVDFGKAALDATANFEQLAGGVEKIFNEMDTSRIFEDANMAYAELNMSANEYLAVINQTGATFAATMGDERGYETARKGLLAISDFASGTGKSVDELSEKFTLITRSTASYQSIADQFSGILPQTTTDFLEQAQAAGFLSDKYKSLTEVPIDEYQAAVTQMLEKGVEDMGLAGNTADETARTISGSLAALSGAWEDWLVSLGTSDADVEAATTKLVDSFITAAKNVLPAFEEILEGLGVALDTGLMSMIEEIGMSGGDFGEAALEAFMNILKALLKLSVEILLALTMMLGSMIVAITEKAIEFFQAAWEWCKEMVRGLAEGFVYVIEEIKRGVAEGVERVKEKWQDFWDAGKYVAEGLAEGIAKGVGAVGEAAAGLAKTTLDRLKTGLQEASPSKATFRMGADFDEGLELGIVSRRSNVMQAVNDLGADMLATIQPQLAISAAGGSTTTYTFGDVHLNAADAYGMTAIEQLIELIRTA